ncbi:MAG TPA: SdrD B-like domain-containing protein [Enteractinococcus sp.]
MNGPAVQSTKTKSTFSRLIATMLAAMLALAGLVAIGPAAYAATQGVNPSVLHNGSAMAQGAVVKPGDTITVRVQYDNTMDINTPVVIGIPEQVSLDESTLNVPSGNKAIQNIELVDEGIKMTFHPSGEWGNQQGVWDLRFTVKAVEHTGEETISWNIDGDPLSFDVIVSTPDDQRENVTDRLAKAAGNANLNGFVSVEDGQVQIRDNIVDHKIRYTLTINTPKGMDRSAFSVSDVLSEHLEYNNDFKASLTTWDENGWNRKTEDFVFSPEISISGNAFDTTLNLPSPSQLTVTYTASVKKESIEALRTAVQEEYDAREGAPGNYRIALGNTANFGGTERSASAQIGGNIAAAPTPGVGNSFSKSGDPRNAIIETDEEGNLVGSVDKTYTFRANLTQWDGRDQHGNPDAWTLHSNVVIQDILPAQAAWNVDASDFITAEGIELTPADFDGDAAAFAADEYVGQYAVVDENTLLINVGRDSKTDATIHVRAQITSIEGVNAWKNDQGWEHYDVDNKASFYYRDGNPHGAAARTTLIDRGDTSQGVDDPNHFTKTADKTGDTVYLEIGESLTVNYEFVVNGVDVTNSYIVDHRDPEVFDLTDEALHEIRDNISGSYEGVGNLGSEDFVVALDDNGDLVIQLSETAIERIGDNVDKRLVVNIPLTTIVFEDTQTLSIENRATLYGEDDQPLYWSETFSEASSYGDEAEVRKTIWDSENADWTKNLRVEIGEDGELVNDELVYRLAFIPHGNYDQLVISPVTDQLPREVEFVGFVSDDNVDSGDNPQTDPVDIGGNLEAVYDADTHSVTIQQQEGTKLNQAPNIGANVLVRVIDFNKDDPEPVTNVFGGSEAVYEPYNPTYAIGDYVWIDDNRDGVQDEGEEPLKDVTVELYTVDSEGNPSERPVDSTTTDVNGRYIFDELEAGDYQVRFVLTDEQAKTYVFTHQEVGDDVIVDSDAGSDGRSGIITLGKNNAFLTADEQYEFNEVKATEGIDPTWDAGVVVKTYAIGDYVWIDEDKDGQQGSEEDPLEGVTVELYKWEDGSRSEDPVATTTTDENGKYLFDELEAGEYQVRFVLTKEQQEKYYFTEYSEGDAEYDSDAGVRGYSERFILNDDSIDPDYSDQDYKATQGVDPTWDAGVIERTYAIGDYVWIDDNRDGVQDEDEKPLEGVKVVLYDGDGEKIGDTTTDENGRYIFDNLKAGEYSVQFILTDEQAEIYEFTTYTEDTENDDSTVDSNAGEEGRSGTITLGPDNEFLTANEDYDHNTVEASEGIDPTWDAGVVLIPVPEIQVDKNEPGDDEHQVSAGEQDVVVTFTNEGNEDLENFQFEDTTEEGHDVVWNEDDLAGLEELVLAPGESYTVNGTVQVDGDTTHRDEVVVKADGVISGETVNDDDPTTYHADPTYAIGDYVWVDKDRDGVQDDNEPALEGVVVELYTVDEEGNPSEEPVDSTKSDENGRYIFDNLDAGDYQVRFILTEEQAELYKFTDYTQGDDSTEDSNAGNEGRSGTITLGPDNEFLTANEDYVHNTVEASRGIDPTWDAGVQFIVQPEIQVDKNESGDDVHQVTAGEHDVTVTITNEGDEDLKNFQFEDTTEEGHDVVWNEDDLAGLEELVLAPGNSYTVNGTVQVDAGTTHRDEVVINANGAISGEAVEGDDPTTYEADEVPPTPTEDPSDPADPAGTDEDTPGDKGGKLSKTGASFALIFGALGLLLLAIGIVLYVRNRQSSKV